MMSGVDELAERLVKDLKIPKRLAKKYANLFKKANKLAHEAFKITADMVAKTPKLPKGMYVLIQKYQETILGLIYAIILTHINIIEIGKEVVEERGGTGKKVTLTPEPPLIATADYLQTVPPNYSTEVVKWLESWDTSWRRKKYWAY